MVPIKIRNVQIWNVKFSNFNENTLYNSDFDSRKTVESTRLMDSVIVHFGRFSRDPYERYVFFFIKKKLNFLHFFTVLLFLLITVVILLLVYR